MILEQLHAEHKARLARMAANAVREPAAVTKAALPSAAAPAEVIEQAAPPPPSDHLTLEQIVWAVAVTCNIPVSKLTSKTTGRRGVAVARNVFCWMAKTMTEETDEEIGKICCRIPKAAKIAHRNIERRPHPTQKIIDAAQRLLRERYDGVG